MSVEVAPYLTLLVVIISVFGAWRIRHWERNQERKALAAAIFAEIRSSIDIADYRQYTQIGEAHIQMYRAGTDAPMPRIPDPDVKSTELIKAYPIFDSNAERIGILGPQTAADVTRYYTQALGISQSLLNWARGGWDNATLDQKIEAIQAEIDLWESTRTLGLRLCEKGLDYR